MFRRLRQFRSDIRGVAAVEFALVLPLLIALYLGSIEAASLYSTDRKVATVASTMADLVSRERGEITTTTLNTYFQAARSIMLPYAATGLVQTVSLLQIDSAGVAKVKWSVANGAPKGRDVGSIFPLDKNTKINELARGSSGWLVASEITYPHKPIVGLVITGTVTLKHVQYYLPRFPNEIKLK